MSRNFAGNSIDPRAGNSIAGNPRELPELHVSMFFFRAHRTNDLTKKFEKVGPFECDVPGIPVFEILVDRHKKNR